MVRREHRVQWGRITADDKLLLQLVVGTIPIVGVQQTAIRINKIAIFSEDRAITAGHGAVTPPDKEPSE